MGRAIHCSELHFAMGGAIHCTELHFAMGRAIHCTELHFAMGGAIHCSELHFAMGGAIHCTELHFAMGGAIHCIELHFAMRGAIHCMNLAVTATKTLPFANDEKEYTCNEKFNTVNLMMKFNYTVRFSFLELALKNPPMVTLSHLGNNITLSFKQQHDVIQCMHLEIWNQEANRSRIECSHQIILFNELTLRGPGVRYICEVYVSAGRNIALRKNSLAEVAVKPSPLLAVDGYLDTCFISDIYNYNQRWTVMIPNHLYQIYNVRIYPSKCG
ncbi:hypothetical protein Btru_013999 [Bulinus truncatus]|nr:hypothetical protein Btru_013999 [Bulinus truncatus]